MDDGDDLRRVPLGIVNDEIRKTRKRQKAERMTKKVGSNYADPWVIAYPFGRSFNRIDEGLGGHRIIFVNP